ncbi:glycoside hydrolase family 1 protein [Fundicoccus culcitae]|uniref:Glycoside hydrolase family 1 protein n=1 Tax=Fundicoccus culcitae TaxID=2969821 RepID=A0ABY5PAA2_9LACT|nr:glycoside hydrolase family 1 protein [Fundicoccus culcitae]UUX35403.1 glycoside hydrolase family 1 protein [Fundicoccus culcitae]
MSETNKGFPKDFLWGASSSAAQVEGGFDQGGRGLSIWDVKTLNPNTASFHYASDFYSHYKEDIALMAEMGFKAYRFSISWSRILPEGEGEVSQAGIQFYRNVLDELHKYNIEPVVTIYHFDLPLALQEKYGGWINRQMIDAYVNYCRILFKNYPEVKYWLTYNEQNMLTFFGAFDMLGSGNPKSNNDLYNEAHVGLVAQAKAIHLCHELLPDAWIGPAPNLTTSYPASADPKDYIAAQNMDDLRNNFYTDALVFGRYPQSVYAYFEMNDVVLDVHEDDFEIMRTCKPDFIGFNCYGNDTTEHLDYYELDFSDVDMSDNTNKSYLMKLMEKPGVGKSVVNPYFAENSVDGNRYDPYAIRVTARRLTERYHLPVLLTENGYGRPDTLTEDGQIHDDYRIEHLRETIKQMKIGIEEGAQLIGYCPWSAMDLVSTREGISKRYGFIYVDRDEDDVKAQTAEMKRYRKDSFHWYKKVIASNGEILD